MPKYSFWESFMREWRKLTPEQQAAFRIAYQAINESMADGQGLPGPPLVQKMQGYDIYEVRWAPNGRATFHLEDADGEKVVMWRRIGDHDIFKRP